MGLGQYTADVPVVKGTSGVLIMTEDEVTEKESKPCIRCGRCAVVCPIYLEPGAMGIFAERDRFEDAESYYVMDCIECGSCSFVCPAGRRIVHYIRFLKGERHKRRARERERKSQQQAAVSN